MKAFVRSAVGLALLGLLLWLGGWGFWHLRIVGTIAALERGAAPAPAGQIPPWSLPPETVKELLSAGSRALPYLVESLQPSANPAYLVAAGTWIRRSLERRAGKPLLRPLSMADSANERWEKCEEHRRAWETYGAPLHRSWRWWHAEPLE
jgi:hypothetical protein